VRIISELKLLIKSLIWIAWNWQNGLSSPTPNYIWIIIKKILNNRRPGFVSSVEKLIVFEMITTTKDRLCGPVVRFTGYGFNSRRYKIFWEVVDLEWDPLNLVSTNEGLLEEKSSGSSLETEIMAVGDPPRWLRDTPLRAKVVTKFADKRGSLGWYSSIVD
jgi:hypothetical protein